MKTNWKSFMSGIIFTVLIFALVGTAAATVGKKTVELSYNNIRVTLDGEPVNLVNAGGGAVEPFIIDGTTYLPVRAVATALGLYVDWDATTKTVILTTSKPTQPPEHTPSTTTSQSNALRSAQNYLRVMAFSHDRLVSQLEYEGYSHDDAVYAADNCGADWNEQAARAAKSYLDLMPYSRDGLIQQLEFDGYTHEQAVYGVEANGY